MKLLKARIWDIVGGKMSAGIDLELFMGGEGCELEFPFTEESLPLKDFLFFRKDYSEWMLFTGIKDKNGKEIYEGDIVICHPERKYGRMEIKIDLYNGFNNGDGGDFEVIGNVYENPNLINTNFKP